MWLGLLREAGWPREGQGRVGPDYEQEEMHLKLRRSCVGNQNSCGHLRAANGYVGNAM